MKKLLYILSACILTVSCAETDRVAVAYTELPLGSITPEGWLKEKSHVNSLLGLGVTLLCRILFGVDVFLLVAMPVILVVLLLRGYRNQWQGGEAS